MLAVFVVVGCTGSFNITRKIYDIHRSQENKWVDELIFLAVAIIPVYGFGMMFDAVIFNSIEFWTGKNPITLSKGDSPNEDFIVERTAMGVVAKDKSGVVVYTSIKDPSGSVSVYDSEYKLVKYFSSEEVQLTRSQMSLN